MKAEQLKQLSQTFKAFGISTEQAVRNVHAFHQALKSYNTMMANVCHKRKCRTIAYALANNTDPRAKNILWNLFKRL